MKTSTRNLSLQLLVLALWLLAGCGGPADDAGVEAAPPAESSGTAASSGAQVSEYTGTYEMVESSGSLCAELRSSQTVRVTLEGENLRVSESACGDDLEVEPEYYSTDVFSFDVMQVINYVGTIAYFECREARFGCSFESYPERALVEYCYDKEDLKNYCCNWWQHEKKERFEPQGCPGFMIFP